MKTVSEKRGTEKFWLSTSASSCRNTHFYEAMISCHFSGYQIKKKKYIELWKFVPLQQLSVSTQPPSSLTRRSTELLWLLFRRAGRATLGREQQPTGPRTRETRATASARAHCSLPLPPPSRRPLLLVCRVGFLATGDGSSAVPTLGACADWAHYAMTATPGALAKRGSPGSESETVLHTVGLQWVDIFSGPVP